MADLVDAATRSRMMSGIRGKDTKPELLVRRGLHALGFRYRLHPTDVPGKPDLFLPRYHAAIFIHGCFWHGHDCALFKQPGSRADFWMKKIATNRARDLRVDALLDAEGIRRLTVWECAFRGPQQIGLEQTLAQAASWLRGIERKGEVRSVAQS